MTPLMVLLKWVGEGRREPTFEEFPKVLVEPVLQHCLDMNVDFSLKDKRGYTLLDHWILSNTLHPIVGFCEDEEDDNFWRVYELLSKVCDSSIPRPLLDFDGEEYWVRFYFIFF
jgi:hypothetical protein